MPFLDHSSAVTAVLWAPAMVNISAPGTPTPRTEEEEEDVPGLEEVAPPSGEATPPSMPSWQVASPRGKRDLSTGRGI